MVRDSCDWAAVVGTVLASNEWLLQSPPCAGITTSAIRHWKKSGTTADYFFAIRSCRT